MHSSQASFIASKIREERESEIEDLKLQKAISKQKHVSDASMSSYKTDEIPRIKEIKAPREEIIRIQPALPHGQYQAQSKDLRNLIAEPVAISKSEIHFKDSPIDKQSSYQKDFVKSHYKDETVLAKSQSDPKEYYPEPSLMPKAYPQQESMQPKRSLVDEPIPFRDRSSQSGDLVVRVESKKPSSQYKASSPSNSVLQKRSDSQIFDIDTRSPKKGFRDMDDSDYHRTKTVLTRD